MAASAAAAAGKGGAAASSGGAAAAGSAGSSGWGAAGQGLVSNSALSIPGPTAWVQTIQRRPEREISKRLQERQLRIQEMLANLQVRKYNEGMDEKRREQRAWLGL